MLPPVGRRLLLLAALLALGGCEDAPTAPGMLGQAAGGREWVAVSAPAELPTAATWLPFLETGDEQGRRLLARVRAGEREADRAWAAGEFARASQLRRNAGRLAASGVSTAPAEVVEASRRVVEGWLLQVEPLSVTQSPPLAAAIASIRASQSVADTALALGDTAAAVRELMAAAEGIRQWSPREIAWRALMGAEQGLNAAHLTEHDQARVRHLVRGARRELISGDPLRALRRALYALQLEQGNGLGEVLAAPTRDCARESC